MTTAVNAFGKVRYNRPPTGTCASGDILQAKVDELLSDIKGVKTYINDIIVLSNNCFLKHTEQPIIISGRLSKSGLKVNAPK